MSNTALTADTIASEALVVLENELGFLDTIHRAYEDEFDKRVNGYKKGETISIRRPVDYTVRDGILADVAPTLLEMLGVKQPKEMTGKSLLVAKAKKAVTPVAKKAVKTAVKAAAKTSAEPTAKKRSVVKKSKGRGSRKWSR